MFLRYWYLLQKTSFESCRLYWSDMNLSHTSVATIRSLDEFFGKDRIWSLYVNISITLPTQFDSHAISSEVERGLINGWNQEHIELKGGRSHCDAPTTNGKGPFSNDASQLSLELDEHSFTDRVDRPDAVLEGSANVELPAILSFDFRSTQKCAWRR
jgi:hypothetical protein